MKKMMVLVKGSKEVRTEEDVRSNDIDVLSLTVER
jgi:hypothetical protein